MLQTIGLAINFVASHRPTENGADAPLHGHNYRLWADVAGLPSAGSGLILPRETLSQALAQVSQRFAYQDLTDLPPIGPPRSLAVAAEARRMLTPLLPRGASLAALEIFDETGSGLRLAASSTAHITAGGFSAAHRAHAPRLSAEENHAHFGASNNPAGHGHNYQVEIETPGPISAPPPPWADLDHRNLSVDIPEFHGRNAVTETVAELIARRVPSAARVRVWESPELFAVYETAPARYQLGRRYRLHAAHQLYDPAVSPAANRRRYGRCAAPAPHGHAYTAYVVVSGPLDPPTETVYDLAALDAAAGPLFRSIDSRGMPHALPELADAPETTEQFAAALWRRLDGALGPALIELVLYETPDARTQVKRGLDG